MGKGGITEWEEIVAVSAGSHHTVGLSASGTVLAIGDNSHRQCEVGEWKDVVAVAAGSAHTLGLCRDGTVVGAGVSADGRRDVASWTGLFRTAD